MSPGPERLIADPPGKGEETATLRLPAIADRQRLGSVLAELTTTRVIRVSAADLLVALGAIIDDETRRFLQTLGPGLIPVDVLARSGLGIALEPATLSLSLEVPPAIRAARTVRASQAFEFAGVPSVTPSDFATGLTVTSFTTGDIARGRGVSSVLDIRGFANAGGIEGINLVFGADVSLAGGREFLRRDRIAVFRDFGGTPLRILAGDLVAPPSRFGANPDVLGLGILRSYQELQPDRNIRPLGRRSLRLERPSMVEVYVNGALVESFEAAAGPIDIRDIPATGLSNQVSIVVEDALGRREIDSFRLGNDVNLLAVGLDEFDFSAGLAGKTGAGGLSYTSDPVASLAYSRGVTENLTVGGNSVISARYRNAGLVLAFAGLGGVTQIDLAGSNTTGVGEGGAVALLYRGTPFDLGHGPSQVNVAAEYRTGNFRPSADPGLADPVEFDLIADVRANVSPTVQLVLGGTYVSRRADDGERAGIFAGFQKQFGALGLGATARYLGEERGEEEFGLLVTASMTLGRRANAFATIDTVARRSRVELRQLRPLTLPEIDFGLRAQTGIGATEFGGRIGLATSRFEAAFDTQQTFTGAGGVGRNRSALRVQTGIGYADGGLAIGREAANGFIMVRKHPSLGDAQVRVSTGSVGRDLAVANSLGPALIPVFTPWRPQEVRIGTQDAPIGYNLGSGEYVTRPGARSGVVIDVGSDAYRIAVATLHGIDGEPLGLATGRIVEASTGKERSFFTNRAGRAVFTGLAPGRYDVILDAGSAAFSFVINQDSPANVMLGLIELGRRK